MLYVLFFILRSLFANLCTQEKPVVQMKEGVRKIVPPVIPKAVQQAKTADTEIDVSRQQPRID